MKRTQIYLSQEQYDFLASLSFVMSKSNNKKISMSELIRDAITLLQKEHKDVEDETDIILQSSSLLNSLNKARKQKKFLDHKDVFGAA